jgi:hypothetical protein
MPKKPLQRDPIGAYQRKAAAGRRVGGNKRCSCGESRPEALVRASEPTICNACEGKRRGRTTFDDHHVAGKANSPVTIQVPVNDHRARLSIAQYDWPKRTLENPDGSPLLAAAACIRGFVDTIFYLIDKLLLWIPEMLEKLNALLVEKSGRKWWIGTDLEQFSPKRRKSNAAPRS